MEFEIGDLVSSDDPGDIGIIIATSADYVKVRWIRLTKERGDFLNGPYWISSFEAGSQRQPVAADASKSRS